VTDTATGITYASKISQPVSITQIPVAVKKFGVPHHSISVSLNVLLTLMIVGRLMLHSKGIRKAMGTSATAGRLYNAIVTMLVESCALYAVTFVLFVGPWAAHSPIAKTFFPILIQTQVRAVPPSEVNNLITTANRS
jgi:hypothetical protein